MRKNDENTHSVPFLSCEKRFKDYKKTESISEEDRNEYVRKDIEPSNKVIGTPTVPFQSSDERFKLNHIDTDVPGPAVRNV
jgi:hypothetical protein